MSYHIKYFKHILELVLSHLVKSKSKAKWRYLADGGGRFHLPDVKRSACFFVGSQIKLAAKSQSRPHSQMMVLFVELFDVWKSSVPVEERNESPYGRRSLICIWYVYDDPLGKFCFVILSTLLPNLWRTIKTKQFAIQSLEKVIPED